MKKKTELRLLIAMDSFFIGIFIALLFFSTSIEQAALPAIMTCVFAMWLVINCRKYWRLR